MSYLRFSIELAVKEPLPQALANNLSTIRVAIKTLKSYAAKINEGQANEELTVRAVYHRCKHDEGAPCEPEQEI